LFTNEQLMRLATVAWRSEVNPVTNHDTLEILDEACLAGLLGDGVTFHVSRPWRIEDVFVDDKIVLGVDMGDGVWLMAEPILFKGQLVPPRTLSGLTAVRHILDTARAAVHSACEAYTASKKGE
jgi:hypothetical protein